jgi:hypothetical protein
MLCLQAILAKFHRAEENSTSTPSLKCIACMPLWTASFSYDTWEHIMVAVLPLQGLSGAHDESFVM